MARECGCGQETPLDDAERLGYQSFGADPMSVDDVRRMMVQSGETAVGPLCYAALQHAAEGITHSDRKIACACKAIGTASKGDARNLARQCEGLARGMLDWMATNPIKSILMVAGLGGSAYEATRIANLMEGRAESFTEWGRSTTTPVRFIGFCGLMTVRLLVSTLVPPTSPAFGIIIQAATPETEKWTAMPLFLAASAVAGAVPYLVDKTVELFTGTDFAFTSLMKKFVEAWPLTCWTWPTMNKVFHSAGGGKMGASLAVIVAHAAPFMGAQTTIMQRYFLPAPLDSILSQPFGMSEDLLTMALAEAASRPRLGSASLTALVAGFNLLQFLIFSGLQDKKALACAIVNVAVGFFVVRGLPAAASPGAVAVVGLQLVIQASGVAFLFTRVFERTPPAQAPLLQ
jgi:hypothetical protein